MTVHNDPMQGIGGTRELHARWIVSGTLTLTSAAHLGGAVDGPADMALIRDGHTGRPVLAGSSLAGSLRSHLADVLGGFGLDPTDKREDSRTQVLFGGARADDDGGQSPLLVHEALAATGVLPVEIRDGVAIGADTGTARKGAKYDIEILPAGTTFPLEFELDIVADESGAEADGGSERWLLGLLACALRGLETGEDEDPETGAPGADGRDAAGPRHVDYRPAPIAIGARSSRGLGRCRATGWRAERFDLTTPGGWVALACDDPPTSEAMGERIHDVLAEALGEPSLESPADRAHMSVVEVDLAFDRSLLIRSPGPIDEPDAEQRRPDVVQLRSGGVPVLSGSSLAGALRAHATRIAGYVDQGLSGPARRGAAQHVEALFGGARQESGGGRGSHEHFRTSALRVAECELVGATPQRAARIRVDRLTRGVVHGGLFEEEPVAGGRARVCLELRQASVADPPALGLLLLVVRDLIDGLIALGGTVAVGRGAIDPESSSATVRLADATRIDLRDPGDDAGRLDTIVGALLARSGPSDGAPS